MIVCHSHRFIYVRTKKTGGASMQWALEQHCGSGDIAVRANAIHGDGPRPGLDLDAEPPKFLWFRECGHVRLSWAQPHVPPQLWDNYFKFVVVRNPWDKMVSAFWHRRDRQQLPRDFEVISRTFREWLLTPTAQRSWRDWHIYTRRHKVAVDFVIRYEDLQTDYNAVCDHVGLPRHALPHFKLGFRADPSHYSRYYDAKCRRVVARLFRHEIETFEYDFEEK